jgi:hypothetical protein
MNRVYFLFPKKNYDIFDHNDEVKNRYNEIQHHFIEKYLEISSLIILFRQKCERLNDALCLILFIKIFSKFQLHKIF